ncbi:NAD(P)/FAD-dependent oxidoreductase [Cryptosporangium sp. NPDC048952]|uniref:NAD(P)/FAD-dependent oxidoreductase n=1 Tax=Cryptosporangium sp. NPDC048952 TaxID=3363961 RepID=UPI00371843C2
MSEIVVLGAGYAGLAAAVSLAGRLRQRDDARVTVVSASDRFTERLRLHQVASGQQVADLRIPDLLDGTGVAFVQGWVTGLDAVGRIVRIDDERELSYDTLVYALGAVADTDAVPGAADHADTLDTFDSATSFATRLASLATRSGTVDGAPGRVVVCGSGLTGVEAAAEIAERYPSLRVTLLGRDAPGVTLGAKARNHVAQALARLGVDVHAGSAVAVQPGGVRTESGETVAADLVLWTSGVRVSPLAAKAGLDVDDTNRIVTDDTLRSVSHPEIYAVGDAAAVRQTFGTLHGTCQSGMPTGVHAAASVARELEGKTPKPFRFGYLHAPISLGRNDAVVQFTYPDDTPKRLALTGRAARWYKETVSAAPWPTFGRTYTSPGIAMLGWRRGGRHTR